MAAKDIVATAMAALQSAMVPSTAVQDLITQRDALYAQAAALQTQIDAAAPDGPAARQALQGLRQLVNRGGGGGGGPGSNPLAGGVIVTQPIITAQQVSALPPSV